MLFCVAFCRFYLEIKETHIHRFCLVLLDQLHTLILSNFFLIFIDKFYSIFNFQFISQLKPDSTIDQCKLMMQPQEHLISTLLQFPLLVFTSSYCLRKLNVRGCDGLKPSGQEPIIMPLTSFCVSNAARLLGYSLVYWRLAGESEKLLD